MIEVMDSDIITQTSAVLAAMKNSKVGVITGNDFQEHAFKLLKQKFPRKYPYEVRIPKSLEEMQEGDFSPSRVITVEKPFEGPFEEIWFGDATAGIDLLCGYINGDNRFIADTALGDLYVHGIMVGATGQGKSVTLNSIIYNVCALYAPWELCLTLSDAKIVEFKSIATSNPMPHIDAVAATSDVDYLLSVLETKHKEMQMTNKVFTKAAKVFGAPVKNIKEFREVTGLMLPQNLMIFDEFQAMFSNAKKLITRIIQLLDAFTRLGRNAGYHLLLTSQELGSDIPKAMLGNITYRAAMGCQPEVSSMILGNPGASMNMGRKGKMIINLNSSNGDATDNINVSVPYIDPQTGEIARRLIDLGREYGVARHMNFYDETEIERLDSFRKWLAGTPVDLEALYLGAPSFVSDEPSNRVVLRFSKEENNNIMVLSATQQNLMRHLIMLKENIQRHGTPNVVSCTGSVYEEYGARELSEQLFFEEKDYEHNQALTVARSVIYRRIACLETDKYIFEGGNTDADVSQTENLFYQAFEKDSIFDTELNRLRFFVMKNLINTDPVLAKAFSVYDDEGKLNMIVAAIKLYQAYGALDAHLAREAVPALTVWMLGFDKLIGFGVLQKTKNMQDFKQMLLDSTAANVRFFMFANSFAEFTELRELMHWYIFDKPVPADITKVNKDDNYPEQIGGPLAVVYDIKDKTIGCRKFKKLFFDGEMP